MHDYIGAREGENDSLFMLQCSCMSSSKPVKAAWWQAEIDLYERTFKVNGCFKTVGTLPKKTREKARYFLFYLSSRMGARKPKLMCGKIKEMASVMDVASRDTGSRLTREGSARRVKIFVKCFESWLVETLKRLCIPGVSFRNGSTQKTSIRYKTV